MAGHITNLGAIDVGRSILPLHGGGKRNCSVVGVTNERSKLSGKGKRGLRCLDGRGALPKPCVDFPLKEVPFPLVLRVERFQAAATLACLFGADKFNQPLAPFLPLTEEIPEHAESTAAFECRYKFAKLRTAPILRSKAL
jgi:hypothetical protein